MDIWMILTVVASFLTIISTCLNVIQYNRRNSLIKRIRSFAQGTYMDHFMIARAIGRIKNSTLEANELLPFLWREIFYINGIADSARNNIISVSKEHLKLVPQFIHPAFPEKATFGDDIKLGIMPDDMLIDKKAEQMR